MRILDAVRLDIPVHHGINGESRHRFDAQFLRDVLPVTDYGGKSDFEFLGNLLID